MTKVERMLLLAIADAVCCTLMDAANSYSLDKESLLKQYKKVADLANALARQDALQDELAKEKRA